MSSAQDAYSRLLGVLGIGTGSRWVYATTNYEAIGEETLSALDFIPELGEVSTEDGAKQIGAKMEDILKKEGYYDGKKALRQ